MKATILYPLLTLAGGMLSSCVYYANPVPEMPYRPSRNVARQAPQTPQPSPALEPPPSAALPEAPWATALPGARPASAEQALPAPKTAPKPKPAPKPAHEISSPTPPPTHITPPAATEPAAPALPKPSPTVPPLQPLPEPKIAAPQAPQQTPAPSANKPHLDKKLITNDGPIPYATKVEGDPTRVYNPLDPNKTIRITDKNGNIYPSGKELKVKGTNYHFYVP